MSSDKSYLGDGVYADFDGYHVVLTTHGINTTNMIFLDDTVLDSLTRYVAALKAKYEQIRKEQQDGHSHETPTAAEHGGDPSA